MPAGSPTYMTTERAAPDSGRRRACLRWLAVQFQRAAVYLNERAAPPRTGSQFVDLAPTDEADPNGVYAEALQTAMGNPDVSNIALTGPYGSGKSSIIRTFLKRHPRPTLHISLAAFLPDAGEGEPGEPTDKPADSAKQPSRQEIERSILQQLLYGADADRLPLSRFKRIKSPDFWSKMRSLYILLGLMALLYVFADRAAILSGAYFEPFAWARWFDFAMLGYATVFVYTLVHYIYVASLGVSLKSVSLKNVELGPVATDQSSILNRHLDEIVYFFQSTNYELVVVEDLDRFDDSDIFVTLREINSLVNGYVGVKRRVQFLYALRDDMFGNTDRTKFFEFIIPVIPIINSSNAIDMVLRQGERLALQDRLDPNFLREVSRYLNDLRLIRNIFNEYAIYVANLETDDENSLDPNKLLAVLIYKNTYPRDFERLHRGEGHLATIFDQRDRLIADAERAYRAEIDELQQGMEAAERQIPRDMQELRRSYAMALVQKLPADLRSVGTSRQAMVAVNQLVDDDRFDEIVAMDRVFALAGYHGGINQHDIRDLQSDVDPNMGYADRVALIEKKSRESKDKAHGRILEMREKIKTIRTSKFNVLLRKDSAKLSEAFAKLGDGGELARFLLLEGYLDDSYYLYTSLFHSGRLSPNDNKFLRHIRGFVTPEPDFPIDNAEEVIENMRAEDFGQPFVLNVKLVDVLLGEPGLLDRRSRLFAFLANEFSKHQDFFRSYYANGVRVEELLTGLSAAWPELVPAMLESSMRNDHLARLIEQVPSDLLGKLSSEQPKLGEYLAKKLSDVLALTEGLEPSRLEPLSLAVDDLSTLEDRPQIVRSLFEAGHYRLTIGNLDLIFSSLLGQVDVDALHRRHLSTLREVGSQPLLDRLGDGFEEYFENVLMRLDENEEEDVSAMLNVLSHDTLEAEQVETFICRQRDVFPSLEGVPKSWRPTLFRVAKIKPTWANCVAFLSDESFEAAALVEFLSDGAMRASLLETNLPAGEDAVALRNFLRNTNDLPDDVYRDFVTALPRKVNRFPSELDGAKRRILVEEDAVNFSHENFVALADEAELQVLFVARNISAYLGDPASVPVDDDFREDLLHSDIADDVKRAVIGLMDLGQIPQLPDRAAVVAPILTRTDVNLEGMTFEVAKALILAANPVSMQITLFNELHRTMDIPQVREILSLLPHPYSAITTGFRRPQLRNTAENRRLAEWLDSRDVISSFGQAFWGDDIVVYLYHGR